MKDVKEEREERDDRDREDDRDRAPYENGDDDRKGMMSDLTRRRP